jgi:hypothetical protein
LGGTYFFGVPEDVVANETNEVVGGLRESFFVSSESPRESRLGVIEPDGIGEMLNLEIGGSVRVGEGRESKREKEGFHYCD